MSDSVKDIAAAQARATAAREDLVATLGEIQARLQPKTLIHEGLDKIKERGTQIADETMDAARAKPALAGTIAGAAVLFVARRPIARLLGRLFFRRTETEAGLTG